MISLDAPWPLPADPDAAARLAERFAALGPAEARLLRRPGFAAMLAAIGGNSPFLSDLAIREAVCLRRMVTAGPDAVAVTALGRIARCPVTAPRIRLAAILREAKRQVALVTALADIGGIWAPAARHRGAQ